MIWVGDLSTGSGAGLQPRKLILPTHTTRSDYMDDFSILATPRAAASFADYKYARDSPIKFKLNKFSTIRLYITLYDSTQASNRL